MTAAQQVEERKAERRRLVVAMHRLKENESWKLIRAKLFGLAPPLGTSFKAADDYNPHAAAFRDGAQSMTRFLMALDQENPDEEETKPDVIADFRGE